MHIRRVVGMVFLFVVSVFATGCATLYETNQRAEPRNPDEAIVLAVMPFQGVSEAPGSGLIIADILANQLYALGKYVLVTPEIVAKRMADQEGDVLSPKEVGSLVGAPYILTGRVTEYTYKSGVGEHPVVGVTARLIDTATGSVVWSATRARTGGGNWFQEDSLSRLSTIICQDLAHSVSGFLKQYSVTARSRMYSTQNAPAPEHPVRRP